MRYIATIISILDQLPLLQSGGNIGIVERFGRAIFTSIVNFLVEFQMRTIRELLLLDLPGQYSGVEGVYQLNVTLFPRLLAFTIILGIVTYPFAREKIPIEIFILRVVGVCIFVFGIQNFLHLGIELTNALIRFLWPDPNSLSPIYISFNKNLNGLFGALTFAIIAYLLGTTAIIIAGLSFLALYIREWLVITTLILSPLYGAALFLNFGPLKFISSLPKKMINVTMTMLVIGVLIAGFMQVSLALGGAMGAIDSGQDDRLDEVEGSSINWDVVDGAAALPDSKPTTAYKAIADNDNANPSRATIAEASPALYANTSELAEVVGEERIDEERQKAMKAATVQQGIYQAFRNAGYTEEEILNPNNNGEVSESDVKYDHRVPEAEQNIRSHGTHIYNSAVSDITNPAAADQALIDEHDAVDTSNADIASLGGEDDPNKVHTIYTHAVYTTLLAEGLMPSPPIDQPMIEVQSMDGFTNRFGMWSTVDDRDGFEEKQGLILSRYVAGQGAGMPEDLRRPTENLEYLDEAAVIPLAERLTDRQQRYEEATAVLPIPAMVAVLEVLEEPDVDESFVEKRPGKEVLEERYNLDFPEGDALDEETVAEMDAAGKIRDDLSDVQERQLAEVADDDVDQDDLINQYIAHMIQADVYVIDLEGFYEEYQSEIEKVSVKHAQRVQGSEYLWEDSLFMPAEVDEGLQTIEQEANCGFWCKADRTLQKAPGGEMASAAAKTGLGITGATFADLPGVSGAVKLFNFGRDAVNAAQNLFGSDTVKQGNTPDEECDLSGSGDVSGSVPCYKDVGALDTFDAFILWSITMASPIVLLVVGARRAITPLLLAGSLGSGSRGQSGSGRGGGSSDSNDDESTALRDQAREALPSGDRDPIGSGRKGTGTGGPDAPDFEDAGALDTDDGFIEGVGDRLIDSGENLRNGGSSVKAAGGSALKAAGSAVQALPGVGSRAGDGAKWFAKNRSLNPVTWAKAGAQHARDKPFVESIDPGEKEDALLEAADQQELSPEDASDLMEAARGEGDLTPEQKEQMNDLVQAYEDGYDLYDDVTAGDINADGAKQGVGFNFENDMVAHKLDDTAFGQDVEQAAILEDTETGEMTFFASRDPQMTELEDGETYSMSGMITAEGDDTFKNVAEQAPVDRPEGDYAVVSPARNSQIEKQSDATGSGDPHDQVADELMKEARQRGLNDTVDHLDNSGDYTDQELEELDKWDVADTDRHYGQTYAHMNVRGVNGGLGGSAKRAAEKPNKYTPAKPVREAYNRADVDPADVDPDKLESALNNRMEAMESRVRGSAKQRLTDRNVVTPRAGNLRIDNGNVGSGNKPHDAPRNAYFL